MPVPTVCIQSAGGTMRAAPVRPLLLQCHERQAPHQIGYKVIPLVHALPSPKQHLGQVDLAAVLLVQPQRMLDVVEVLDHEP